MAERRGWTTAARWCGYGGLNERCAEHHRATVELSSALTRPGMDGGDVATETGLTAELRRARMRCGGLPSPVNGTGGGSALLGWWWSYGSGAGVARRELCAAMATAELR